MTAQQLDDGASDWFSVLVFRIGIAVRNALDALEPVATWILHIASPIAILSVAYLSAVILIGSAKNPNTSGFADTLKFSTYASLALKWSFFACAASFLVLAYDDRRYGAIIAGLGLAFAAGASAALTHLIGSNLVSATISGNIRDLGTLLLVLGLSKAGCDLLAFLTELPERMRAKHARVGAGRPIEAKQRQVARGANLLSPCWQLPFCREKVRGLCPAFLARRTCWKFGRGCYCDDEMVGRIVRGEPLEIIKAPTKMSLQKPPCGNCYIFLEHQGHKFRNLSPLALPATVALCHFAWPFYSKLFSVFHSNLNAIFGSVAVDVTKLTPDAIKADPESAAKAAAAGADSVIIAGWAQNCVGVVLGFLALVYISKGIEWAIYKAKL